MKSNKLLIVAGIALVAVLIYGSSGAQTLKDIFKLSPNPTPYRANLGGDTSNPFYYNTTASGWIVVTQGDMDKLLTANPSWLLRDDLYTYGGSKRGVFWRANNLTGTTSGNTGGSTPSGGTVPGGSNTVCEHGYIGGTPDVGNVRVCSWGDPEKDKMQLAILRVLCSSDEGGWKKWRDDRHGNTANGKWFQDELDSSYQVYWAANQIVLGRSTGYGDYRDYYYPNLEYIINTDWSAFKSYVNEVTTLLKTDLKIMKTVYQFYQEHKP